MRVSQKKQTEIKIVLVLNTFNQKPSLHFPKGWAVDPLHYLTLKFTKVPNTIMNSLPVSLVTGTELTVA